MRQLGGDEARRLSDSPLTYTEVGATLDSVLPQGYRVIQRERRCSGSADFDAARNALFTWALHERAGLVVEASGPVAAGAVVRLGLRIGPLIMRADCRVVVLIDEPGRAGFAYGTLPGHPETGEELFEVVEGEDGLVVRITAFSRPARLYSRMGGPFACRVQDRVTDRYLRSLD